MEKLLLTKWLFLCPKVIKSQSHKGWTQTKIG